MRPSLVSADGPAAEKHAAFADDSSPGRSVIRSIAELERLVDGLIAGWLKGRALLNPRRYHRLVYCQTIALTPLADATCEPADCTLRVEARDISHGGLSFQHCRPLVCRTAAVTFPRGIRPPETVILNLKWCRFTWERVYRSGGQFLRCQSFGWEESLDFSTLPTG